MAYIACRTVKGKNYYCKVESYREGGKVKQRVLEYYGTTDPRKNPDAKPIIKSSVCATYRFGDVALLHQAAEKIRFIEIVNRFVPKRQGLSLGLELFLTAAHRLLDGKPSASNLSAWVRTTHLPMLLNFDSARITNDTQEYLSDKLYDEEKNVDHLLKICKEVYDNTLPLFGKEENTFFYDITSTYFEGKCCPIARLGYSRDDAVDKLQINIGMVVNGSYGIPLMTKVFEGNVNDATTVYEMVYYAKFILKKEKGLLVMDRGMDSEDNIRIMDTVGYDYVIGLRSNHDFVEELKNSADASSNDWEVYDNKGQEIRLQKFTKNVFGKRRHVVLYYSPSMAALQLENRTRGIENAVKSLKAVKNLSLDKAKKAVNGFQKYFVIEQHGKNLSWRVDAVEVNRALKRDGKFCMITNLDVSAVEVYKLYFSKDKIEKGFRCMKQDVSMHPTRKRLADRVRVDVFVCHLAYVLLRVAEHLAQQKINGVFWDVLSSECREIRLIEYGSRSENKRFQAVANNDFQKNCVEKLGLTWSVPLSLQKTK